MVVGFTAVLRVRQMVEDGVPTLLVDLIPARMLEHEGNCPVEGAGVGAATATGAGVSPLDDECSLSERSSGDIVPLALMKRS